jgi:iron complex transport system permease protein
MRHRAGVGLAVAVFVLLIGVGVAFAVGRFPVSILDLGRVLWAKLTGSPSGLPPAVETVVWQIRGPRVAAAVLVGSALAVAVAAF